MVSDPAAPPVDESNPIVSVVKLNESSNCGIELTDLFLRGGFLGVLNDDDLENNGMINLFNLYHRCFNLYRSLNRCL